MLEAETAGTPEPDEVEDRVSVDVAGLVFEVEAWVHFCLHLRFRLSSSTHQV